MVLSLAYLFIGMLPASILLFTAIYRTWKRRNTMLNEGLFALCMTVMILLFFSLSSTELINYTTPAYPFLALLIGYTIDGLLAERRRGTLLVYAMVNLVISISIPIVIYMLSPADSSLANLQTASLFTIALPIGGLLTLILVYFNKYLASMIVSFMAHALTGMLFFYFFAPQLDGTNPVRTSPITPSGDEIVISYRLFNPAFVSMWDREIPNYYSELSLKSHLDSLNRDAYIVTQERYLRNLLELDLDTVHMKKDVFEKQTSVILFHTADD